MEMNRTHECGQIIVDPIDYDSRDDLSQVANDSHHHQLPYQLGYIPEKTTDPRELFAMRYREANESWSCHWNRFALKTKDYIVANRTRCVDTRNTGFGTVYQRHGSVGGRYVVNVEVFKSATSTVHSVLSLRYCPSINQTVWLSKLQNCIIPVSRGYHFAHAFELEGAVTAFAIIRHPVRRFVSGYTEMIKHFTWCQEHSPFCQDSHKAKPPAALLLALNQTGEEPHRFNAFVDLFTSKGFNILEDYILPISTKDDGHGDGLDDDDGETTARREQKEEILPNNGLVSYATGMLHCLSQMWFLSQYPGRILYLARLEDNLGSKINWIKKNVMNLTLSEKEIKAAFRKVHSYDSRWGTPNLEYILKRPGMYQRSIQKLNDYFQQELEFFGYEPLMFGRDAKPAP
eukprot:CAMPEP_0185262654 /NCGR_PEP_ID=MMETSP1359-20130426/10745_1 /TAXON_ID=552665 /ORGANISM="Bigelowiella longifila, Strain CCMP242" /LENGTH=401 /DNA_ID=CAMNT_0027849661 /DNA_START=211 /DNA_END=1416 /DNA_ORIENTATION=+